MLGASRPPEPLDYKRMMPDIIGLIGVVLAVIGMSDMMLAPRLLVLLSSSVCMPASYFARRDWPVWIRWSLSFATNSFLVLVAWSYIRYSGIMVR